MSAGWEAEIKKKFDEVNNGVSAKELETALSNSNSTIASFKDFILDNSKPLPKGKIDAFELMEDILEAMGSDDHDSLTKEMFVMIVEKYVRERHHNWNDTFKEEVEQWFDHINADGDASLTRKEIFTHIFTWFDRNGDMSLNTTEIKQMFEGYAQALGRTLKQGWWENHVLPTIKAIESGVSPDELW
jgi:hypothetical protein